MELAYGRRNQLTMEGRQHGCGTTRLMGVASIYMDAFCMGILNNIDLCWVGAGSVGYP